MKRGGTENAEISQGKAGLLFRRTADYFPFALQADRAQRLGHKTMISCDQQVIRKSGFSRDIRRRSGVLTLEHV